MLDNTLSLKQSTHTITNPYFSILPAQRELDHFINQISFKKIQPLQPVHRGILRLIVSRLLGSQAEINNTFHPLIEEERKSAIQSLCNIPKASTYALGLIINQAVKNMQPEECFVNVGVWNGFTFLSGLLENRDKVCIGVDNFSVHRKVNAAGAPEYYGLKRYFYRGLDRWARRSFYKRFKKLSGARHYFFEMDYVSYFKHVHKAPIGFYIYDAQHRYLDQYRGLELAEPFLTKGSHILIDDTNAPDNRGATLDFIRKSKNEYKILFDQNTAENRHPTFWNGVMILKKVT